MTNQNFARPLEGKIAIVTGASRGIGASIARNLASKGAHILAVYSSTSSTALVEALVEELTKDGIKIVPCQADLAEPEGASKKIVEAAKGAFSDQNGDLIVNILVNNAGVGGDYPLSEVPVSEFHRMYTVNVLAPILVTQAIIPFLPHERSGRIINISSVASSMGSLTHSLYGGTKAALEAMTRTWARKLAERATVNAVNPGPVEGDMYFAAGEAFWKQLDPFQQACPLSTVREGIDDPALVKLANEEMFGRRSAHWREVAAVVGMLAGPDSSWTTGSVICAHGGFKFQT